VDTRNWTLEDVGRHPLVVRRIVQLGKAQDLMHVTDTSIPESAEDQLLEAANHPPTSAPATQPMAPPAAE
jgi:hypothetical protein